jgi:CRISPR-associated protein Cas2
MRLLVFYDLPVVKVEDRRIYARFRKFLLKDGYDMVQFSVYARICNGQEAVDKHIGRLRMSLPEKGNVRCMQVTEKQFVRMMVLVGEKNLKESPRFAKQLSIF